MLKRELEPLLSVQTIAMVLFLSFSVALFQSVLIQAQWVSHQTSCVLNLSTKSLLQFKTAFCHVVFEKPVISQKLYHPEPESFLLLNGSEFKCSMAVLWEA